MRKHLFQGSNGITAGLVCLIVAQTSGWIMVVELAAGRQLSAILGQSIGVWAVVLAVALLLMAVGSIATPWLLARWTVGTVISRALWTATAACAMTSWVIPSFEPLALAPLTALVPLMALTALLPVAPLTIALTAATSGVTVLGGNDRRIVAAVYALQATGAVVGSLMTGHLLLLYMGHSTVLLLAALTLGATALLWMRVHRASPSAVQASAIETAHPVPVSLMGSVFLCGATFLGLEVAGGRLLAATFGQSIYTWTAVITIALLGSALGSVAGGRMTRSVHRERSIIRLLMATSFCVLLAVPTTRSLVDPDTLRIPFATLLFALVLLGPPAVLLGALGPVMARYALVHNIAANRVYGVLFASSAIGNLTGALGVVAILLPWIGGERTFLVLACLPALALLFWRGPGRFWLIVPCVLLLTSGFAPKVAMELGMIEEPLSGEIYHRESRYSTIRIVTDAEEPSVRRMVLDRLVHSKIDMDQPDQLLYDYNWVYAGMLDLAYGPGAPLDTLSLGGGGYVFPRYLQSTRSGGHTEVAEIDPAVTRAAIEAFGLSTDSAIITLPEDARRSVRHALATGRQYDVVFGDTFNHYAVPAHLTTIEFHRALRGILKNDGLYMLNLVDLPSSARFVASMVLTCREVFPEVWLFDGGGPLDLRETYVVVCANHPLTMNRLDIKVPAEARYQPRLVEGDALDALLERGHGRVLTDNHAPVELLLAPASKP